MATDHDNNSVMMPINILWSGILLIPIFGVLDSASAQQLMDDMLEKIASTRSRVIILDILGVPIVDTAVANHFIHISKATGLMGCQCIISGISPAIAQTIVHLGIDLSDIPTSATLEDALQEAFRILDLQVIAAEKYTLSGTTKRVA